MPAANLRHSVRALVLDEQDRILLVRIVLPEPPRTVVWAAPGGGIESGEMALVALRRELAEEVGLALTEAPPHVWRQEVERPGYPTGYDGVRNDYYLVRTASFRPRGAMSDDELTAENIHGTRWWSLSEIAGYRGPDQFSPRDLVTPMMKLIDSGVPAVPVQLGL